MSHSRLVVACACVLLSCTLARADIKVAVDHNDSKHATAAFRFEHVPSPSKTDAASTARLSLIEGRKDDTGGDLDVLRDGLLPTEADEPDGNFFFAAGSRGGRILIDLGSAIDVKQVNSYSWHTDDRAPQVYTLYAAPDAAAMPAKGADPATLGWTKLADVDTRPKSGPVGGQYAVSISNSAGSVGKFRYLLIDASRTESTDVFGNTFFSEIDVIDGNELLRSATTGTRNKTGISLLQIDGGKYTATLDTSETPRLTQWANAQLAPMVIEWYPRLVKLLASPGYAAPTHFSITFRKDKAGVADTLATRINCAEKFFQQTLNTQAKGAILHEMVHVVQNYGIANHTNPHPKQAPTWLSEGIADYVRWYLYEPKSHGTDISQGGLAAARYDGSYRITANFLDWTARTYDRDLVPQLNAVIRQGNYSEEIWTKLTGKPVQTLGDEWKKELAQTVK